MEIILKNVKKKDFPLIKSLAKSLAFEIVEKIEETEKPYNPEFVKEILQAEKDIKDGKGIKMTLEEINDFSGIWSEKESKEIEKIIKEGNN